MKNFAAVICTLFSFQANCLSPQQTGMPCADPKVQSQRSTEMEHLRQADQADRGWQLRGEPPTLKTLAGMNKHDLIRRKRVGEIFGEGCLNTAADYKAAFIIYQHGNNSDHYFQAFIWSHKVLLMGDQSAKSEVAMAIDRYLVSVDHKQLFGTQATKSIDGDCWCIQPVEESFPQSLRDDYRGGDDADFTGLAYLKILNAAKNCPVAFCGTKLQPSPQGTVPGFW